MKHFAVVGNPIAHSRSPEIHLAFARQTGIALDYQRLEAPVTADGQGFVDTARDFFAAGGSGLNITAPFKGLAAERASNVSERSHLSSAANTLSSDGQGGWRADTTDGVGLVRDLTGRLGLTLAGRRLLILGTGGATAGILTDLLAAQPDRILLWNRTPEKAQRLATRFSRLGPVSALADFEGIDTPFDLVIHATSQRDPVVWPWPASLCRPATFFYDLIYLGRQPPDSGIAKEVGGTSFMQWARQHGAGGVSDGLGMLVEQAAESFYLWHGVRPETAPVIAALR